MLDLESRPSAGTEPRATDEGPVELAPSGRAGQLSDADRAAMARRLADTIRRAMRSHGSASAYVARLRAAHHTSDVGKRFTSQPRSKQRPTAAKKVMGAMEERISDGPEAPQPQTTDEAQSAPPLPPAPAAAFPPAPAPAMAAPIAPLPAATIETGLTPRMRQTLQHLLCGDSEKQIAGKLRISRHTVHVYVKQIYRRYNVNSRGELFAQWVRR